MQEVVNNYGPRYLLHFTQSSNLTSIFQNGILPVSEVKARNISYNGNDVERWDNCLDASCFTIEFPNYKYFYRLANADANVDWVVLGIKINVLWEKDCLFCRENAAHNNVRSIPRNERRGVEAFKKLYEEYPGKPLRATLGIPENYPTHPQAEVLVLEKIEPNYIFSVAFKDDNVLKKYKHLIPESVGSEVVRDFYYARMDHKYWGTDLVNG